MEESIALLKARNAELKARVKTLKIELDELYLEEVDGDLHTKLFPCVALARIACRRLPPENVGPFVADFLSAQCECLSAETMKNLRQLEQDLEPDFSEKLIQHGARPMNS